MPYSVKSIANAFLNRAALEGKKLTHLKLQKLMYYAVGYYLAAYGEPLVDARFEAWDYGPVLPELYQEFREFRNRPITQLANDLDWDTGEMVPVPIPSGDKRVDHVVDYVWRTYSPYSALQLSDMTHNPGTPWEKTRKDNPGIRGVDIPDELLKDYFGKKVKPAQTQNA